MSFFELSSDMPVADDVIAYLKERGFVVYDTMGLLRLPEDDALAQMDFMFVRADHRLRGRRTWWVPQQLRRPRQTARRLLVFNQYYWPGVEATANLLTELCEALWPDFDVTVVTGRLAGYEDRPTSSYATASRSSGCTRRRTTAPCCTGER